MSLFGNANRPIVTQPLRMGVVPATPASRQSGGSRASSATGKNKEVNMMSSDLELINNTKARMEANLSSSDNALRTAIIENADTATIEKLEGDYTSSVMDYNQKKSELAITENTAKNRFTQFKANAEATKDVGNETATINGDAVVRNIKTGERQLIDVDSAIPEGFAVVSTQNEQNIQFANDGLSENAEAAATGKSWHLGTLVSPDVVGKETSSKWLTGIKSNIGHYTEAGKGGYIDLGNGKRLYDKDLKNNFKNISAIARTAREQMGDKETIAFKKEFFRDRMEASRKGQPWTYESEVKGKDGVVLKQSNKITFNAWLANRVSMSLSGQKVYEESRTIVSDPSYSSGNKDKKLNFWTLVSSGSNLLPKDVEQIDQGDIETSVQNLSPAKWKENDKELYQNGMDAIKLMPGNFQENLANYMEDTPDFQKVMQKVVDQTIDFAHQRSINKSLEEKEDALKKRKDWSRVIGSGPGSVGATILVQDKDMIEQRVNDVFFENSDKYRTVDQINSTNKLTTTVSSINIGALSDTNVKSTGFDLSGKEITFGHGATNILPKDLGQAFVVKLTKSISNYDEDGGAFVGNIVVTKDQFKKLHTNVFQADTRGVESRELGDTPEQFSYREYTSKELRTFLGQDAKSNAIVIEEGNTYYMIDDVMMKGKTHSEMMNGLIVREAQQNGIKQSDIDKSMERSSVNKLNNKFNQK